MRRLQKEIIVVLVVKVILLWGLWSLFFSDPIPKEQRLERIQNLIIKKEN
jgi:hypothetical protein